jgi:hypothetical protein
LIYQVVQLKVKVFFIFVIRVSCSNDQLDFEIKRVVKPDVELRNHVQLVLSDWAYVLNIAVELAPEPVLLEVVELHPEYLVDFLDRLRQVCLRNRPFCVQV